MERSRMKKQKLFVMGVILFVVGVSIALFISRSTLTNKHHDEIVRIISERGGGGIKVQKINSKASPFRQESGKYNIIYRVDYQVNGNIKTAWYRGVNIVNNIHSQTPYLNRGGFGEKWLFSEE